MNAVAGAAATTRRSSLSAILLRLVLVAGAGALVAIVAHYMWELKTTLLAASVLGVVLVSFSMLFLRRFSDFLLVSLLVSIPLASFTKTFLFTSWDHDAGAKAVMRFSGVLSLSVPDILLAGLYFMWGFNVVVLRSRPLPRFEAHDILPLALIGAYLCSIPGSPYPRAAVYGLIFLLQHVALYVYLTRHLELRHLPWVVIAIAFAIIPETMLAGIQYGTGKWLSLAWSRGAGDLETQYVVPGIEHIKRATGTTYDSHSFGIYLGMLAAFPFVIAFARYTSTRARAFWILVFVLAMMAVVLSFSRSAWLSTAVALSVLWAVHVILWRQREVIPPTALFALLLLVAAPWWAPLIWERVSSAGSELLTSRFEQFPVAWAIWKDHFLFGFGVGNYMDALPDYNEPGVLELPVHNALLWVGAESGLFGVVSFFGIAVAALWRSWKLVLAHREPTCTLALAVFGAIFAYLLDGLTDPLFREPVVYRIYWVCVALSVALVRIDRQLTSGAVTGGLPADYAPQHSGRTTQAVQPGAPHD